MVAKLSKHFEQGGSNMSDLSFMRNIGKEMEKKLKAVDIHTAQDLIDIGSKEAFIRLKARDPKICLVHLYALEGAVSDMEYNHLSEDVKRDLKEFSDGLK